MKTQIYFIDYPTGELLTFNSFKAAAEYFYFKGRIVKNWIGQLNYIIHKLESKGVFLKQEAEFLNKYGLSHSVFNVGCIQNLNAVFLFKAQFDKIKMNDYSQKTNIDDKNKVVTILDNNNKNLNNSTIKNNSSTENSNKSKTKGLNTI